MNLQLLNIDEPFELESGAVLPKLTIGFHAFGQNRGDNVVWVCHAFSGNSNPHDWWEGLFGQGKTFDSRNYFIVCANIIGSCYGTTNPLSLNPLTGEPYGLSFPVFSIRDMVRAHVLLRKYLTINEINFLIGPSLGGFQALEWAVIEPQVIRRLVLVATNARQSAWGIALNETQRMALESDGTWGQIHAQAATKGLQTARAMAMLSYRSYEGYNQTQTDAEEKIDHFRASSYQRYQGEKFAKRFNAYSYWYLTKAMDTHNVGRERGGLDAALRSVKAQTHILAVSSDRLYPLQESQQMASCIQGSRLEVFDSEFGHDGFLVATEKIANYLTQFILNQQ